MANFQPSKFQQAIYDFVLQGIGNLIINAVAGSGKTTTIINIMKLLNFNTHKICFLAFNKSIIAELKLKIDNIAIDVKTINSLGWSAVFKYANIPQSKISTWTNDYKYSNYIKNELNRTIRPTSELEPDQLPTYISNLKKLTNLYRQTLCKSGSDLLEVAEKYAIELVDNECEYVPQIVKWGLSNFDTIDFVDQIYIPVALNLRMPMQYDYVFIDEVQDLSACQRALFQKAVKPNGRFIAVGDPSQAIYGFAGADVDSFNALKDIPNTSELPLSVCYRCGSDIVNLAKELVPNIEAKEDAEKGEIIYDVTLDMIQANDLILSRVNAPLIALCMRYIGQGTKAYVKGRDIGTNLIKMINDTNCRYIADVFKKIYKESDKVIAKIVRTNKCDKEEAMQTSTYQSYLDKVQAIEILSENLQLSNDVVNRIESIFKDESNGICLSSVHKAKGLEADRVFIICKDKFYNKYAMRIPTFAVQEANLEYVAITRAKKLLGYVADKEMEFYTKR